MKDQIIKALGKASGVKDPSLEIPENEKHGDYSTNVAMVLAKKEGKNPREFAQELVTNLQKDKNLGKIVSKIEVAGPGFINFWLSKQVLNDILVDINKKKDAFGKSDFAKGKKIMVEFAHPNTHKSFHIGHLRNITTGEAISRILEASGAKVIRANYQGDVGLHIAKAIWGVKKLGLKDLGDSKLRAEFLGKAYVAGNSAYEENEKSKEEIVDINKALYEAKDRELMKLYQATREWSLDYFDSIYKRVYTKFDRLYFESEVAQLGKKEALNALGAGILEKSEGAVIFSGEKFGLHNRVFITQNNTPTYEAKDLGLVKLQFSEFKPDLILHVVGPEQSGYFEVVFKAIETIDPETKGKEIHLPYGWVRLREGKMSSRKGNVVLGEDLLDQAKQKIIEGYKTPVDVAEQIAVGAVKYSFLKVGREQDIAYDINESISLEGNSGPYLQYAYARTQSVLAKSKRVKEREGKSLNSEELSILRTLVHFPEVIESATINYAPNLICNYLFDLAQKFNNFYSHHRILDDQSERVKELKSKNIFRLFLTTATGQVLKSGLNLLGIQAPERM